MAFGNDMMTALRTLSVAIAICVAGVATLSPAWAQFGDNLLDTRPAETVAVENGDYDALRSLLIGGSNTGVSDYDGRSLLMIAASLDDIDIMELLFSYNVQIEQKDRNGATALHWAIRSGAIDATALLLGKGADPNTQTDQGLTPTMLAVRENDRYLVEKLLRRNPDLSIADYTGRSAMDWARKARDRSIETLLMEANGT